MPFFFAFKKKSKNEQYLKDHRKDLIFHYNEYAKTNPNVDSNPQELFNNYLDNKAFLSHLSTGYESTYQLFMDYISLKQEIDTLIMSEPIWREKTKRADDLSIEFKHAFEKLLVKIMHGSEEFEGVCHECKKWHSEDDPNSKSLLSKLSTFKMPF
jgi:hypothetical protein